MVEQQEKIDFKDEKTRKELRKEIAQGFYDIPDKIKKWHRVKKSLEDFLKQNRDLPEQNPTLYKELLDLLNKFQWFSFFYLSSDETIDLFKQGLNFALSRKDYPLENYLSIFLLNIPLLSIRDEYKTKIRDALLENKEKITSKKPFTTANWLKLYNQELGTGTIERLKIAEFLTKNKSIRDLSSSEKEKIKRLFEFYEELKISALTIQGLEEEEYTVTETGIELLKRGRVEDITKPAVFETDIEQKMEDIYKKDIPPPPSLEPDQALANVMAQTKQFFPDSNLKKRFKSILESYLKDVRSEVETSIVLKRNKKVGGLGLDKEIADKVMQILNKQKSMVHPVKSDEVGISPKAKLFNRVKVEPKPDSLGVKPPKPEPAEPAVEPTPPVIARSEATKQSQPTPVIPPPHDDIEKKSKVEPPKEPPKELLKDISEPKQMPKPEPAPKPKKKQKLPPAIKKVMEEIEVKPEPKPEPKLEPKPEIVPKPEPKPEIPAKPPLQARPARVEPLAKTQAPAPSAKQPTPKPAPPVIPKSGVGLPQDISEPKQMPTPKPAPKPEPKPEQEKIDPVKSREAGIPPEEELFNRVEVKARIHGPVGELQALTLVDWHRWGTPEQAAQVVQDKINLLAEDSLTKKAEGIKAWKNSEIHKLYLEIGEESINKGKSVAQIIQERQRQSSPTLTEKEFNTVVELNENLRF